jgi:hypothetical protein
MKTPALISNGMSRGVLRSIAVAAVAAGAMLGITGAASASPAVHTATSPAVHASASPAVHAAGAGWAISWSSSYLITASYDLLNVDVAGASTASGAGVIQWPANGGSNQVWYFGTETYNGVYQGTVIDNANSGLCLQTDGVAGDGLTQGTCYYGDLDEAFDVNGSLGGYDSFKNLATGLYLDVSGYSWSQGASIDLWYSNNQPNQTFKTTSW